MTQVEFCRQVGEITNAQYDVEDGSDLCYNLIDMAVIDMADGVDNAARIVAQHILQS
jgi:hypothetical protein